MSKESTQAQLSRIEAKIDNLELLMRLPKIMGMPISKMDAKSLVAHRLRVNLAPTQNSSSESLDQVEP